MLNEPGVDQYRIEKLRLALSLRLLGGEVLEGHVFLQSFGYSGTPESALELLNQPDRFFPIACNGQGILLVAKERLVEAWGEAVGEEDALRSATSVPVSAELRLASSLTVSGTMLLEVPDDRPRMLDFLNHNRQRFVRVATASGPRLVNARLVESVRPLD